VLPETSSTPVPQPSQPVQNATSAPLPYSAQEGDDSLSNLELSLEDLLNIKVTLASKTAETVAEAPSAIAVFTREDIRRMGVRSVQQLLNFVPGFVANSDESDHYQSIDVRGRSSPDAEGVLMMIDGQRVNDLFFGYPGMNNAVPTENIEQVEIIRGPASALYGANAFIAVINIKTNRTHTDVTLGAGDMNRRYTAINAAKSYGDLKLASFVKLYADQGQATPNFTDSAGHTVSVYDPVRQLEGSGSLEYRGLYLRARYSGRAYDGANCCSGYSLLNKYTTEQTTAQGGYTVALTPDVDLNVYGYYQHETYLAVFPASMASLSVHGLAWNAWSVSPNADLQWRVLSKDPVKLVLLAGGTYAYDRAKDVGLGSQDPAAGTSLGGLYPIGQSIFGDTSRAGKRNIAAGYLQAKVDLWSQLSLTLGGRYDWYNDFGKSINPRAALVWTTPFKSHLKLAYGRAFRAPQVSEIGLSKPEGLDPEIIQTYEAGYVQQVLGLAEVTADFFYQKLDNLITYDAGGAAVNAGKFATKGLELEVRTPDIHGTRLLGSYTHLFREADDPGVTPKDFGSVAVNYAWHGYSANVNTVIRGSVNQSLGDIYATGSTASVEKKAHALLNLHLQAELVKAVRVFATVDNVLDYRYHPDGLQPGYFARGRTFLVGLAADF
jgi:outer membrane receptor protein involved in Fe transport